MGFRLQQKSLTLNDLERHFTDLSSVLCGLWRNSRGCHHAVFAIYKVALYFIYLHIKFDDEIKTESIQE